MAQWEKIVNGKDLQQIKTKRSKIFIEKKERRSALPELINEGWVEYRQYKDSKFVGVKQEKRFDEIFEDQVWLLFANLGFTDLNNDRSFNMNYDYNDATITQQIDVFAADEETIIIVECKAAENPNKTVSFKKNIEAFYGQTSGLRKEAMQKYPGRKVKFIWATHNYTISKADLNKLNEWNIAYFNDTTIDYYNELARHIGTSARYQLLGNLFANQEIKNMDNKIPAIQGKMGGYTYYSFSIEPEKLLKISYVLHRNEANSNMMPTYQRLIKKKRLKEVRDFIEKGGYFPNSIIVSIDTSGKGIQFDQSSTKNESSISKLGILHLPKQYRSAYIIDGQHRLYGYSNTKFGSSNTIPVVAFIDLDRKAQIQLFMDINENQKAVPKTLRVTLSSDILWDSPNYNEQRSALRSRLAQMLGENPTSPLEKRIVIGENEKTSTKCITIEAIQKALRQCQFLSTFDKNNNIIKDGTFDVGNNSDENLNNLYTFIVENLLYLKNFLEDEWSKGDTNNGLLTINRGIQGIIRILNDVINLLIAKNIIHPKEDKLEFINKEVQYYLDPLIDFFSSITEEQRIELKGYFGSGADTKFWRTFQKVISSQRTDFKPDGLDEYWLDQEKTFNDSSINSLNYIEKKLREFIAKQLEMSHGKDWIITALPKDLYLRIRGDADKITYENTNNGNPINDVNILDFITLLDCKRIIIYGRNWSEIFSKYLIRPEDQNITGGKDAQTHWIQELQTIKNKLNKSSYSATRNENELIKSIYNWLTNIY